MDFHLIISYYKEEERIILFNLIHIYELFSVIFASNEKRKKEREFWATDIKCCLLSIIMLP